MTDLYNSKDFYVKKAENMKDLTMLYSYSSLTVEGLRDDLATIYDFYNWLKSFDCIKKEAVFVITKGKLMNEIFGLTKHNRYPDDLSIVSILDINYMNVVIERHAIGGRWFDDIVDNNLRREKKYANYFVGNEEIIIEDL